MGEERYNPGFLTDDEQSRERRRTREMVQSIVKGDLTSAKENDKRIDKKRLLKSFGLKVNKDSRIDIQLREGLYEESSHASYITLSIHRKGNRMSIHIKKAQACQLSQLLNQLVAEGNNFDYQRLKSKYPNQESWHIY